MADHLHTDWETNARTHEVRCGHCHVVFAIECPTCRGEGRPTRAWNENVVGPGCATCDPFGFVRVA